MIIAVGFKVNNQRAVRFRVWANQIVEQYTIKGWAMDEERLKNGGTVLTKKYFEEQLERIREIRISERNFYQKLTDIYATSLDYDRNAMTKEDAYALLESIAKLSGTMDKLQRLTPEGHEIADEEAAAEIQEEAKERKAPFSFIKCGIPMGAEVVLQNHPEVVAVVKDDRQIEYQGKTYSLSALAQKIMQTTYPLQGPVHWLYQGRKLRDIRVEREEAGLYE